MTNTNPDDSREWAAQAYALLKKRQEEKKQELEKQEEEKTRIRETRGEKTRIRETRGEKS